MTLQGCEGNDVLYGGSGDDRLSRGTGDDILRGGLGSDVMEGGAGDDRVFWSPPSPEGAGNPPHDTATGGEGNDVLVLDVTEVSLEDVLAAMVLDPGSAVPVIQDGMISLAGVSGTLTINGGSLTFSGFERLLVPEAPRIE